MSLDPNKISFTIDQATFATGMSRQSIYKLIREGKLKPSSPCGRKLIAREQLLQVLADSEGKESPTGRGHNAKAAIEARWGGKRAQAPAKRRVAK